jgi:hypothetical protein
MAKMTEGEIVDTINDYLDRGMGSTIEQVIMRRAIHEIRTLRKERDHLMTQLINIGEKPNARRGK